MSTMNAWKNAVLDRLIDGGDGLAGFGTDQVFAHSIPDPTQLPKMSDGRVMPYIAIWFGQRVGGGPGFNGVCGVRANAHVMHFLAVINAADGVSTMNAVDHTSELLRGYRPASQGELEETSALTIRRPLDISGVDSRNTVPVAYSGTVDL